MMTLEIDKLLDGRSHYWLAKQTGIAHSTIQRLARPEAQKVSFAVLDKLCEALKCEPGDLLKRRRDNPSLTTKTLALTG
jgi:DNA-binding Xre family transcriptional regulator